MNYYDNQTYYDILRVKEDASPERITQAKNELKYGKNGNREDALPFDQWAKIDEAYSVLSDPEKRKEYDEKLKGLTDIYSSSDFSDATSTSEEPAETIEEKKVSIEEPTKTIEEVPVSIEEPIDVIEEHTEHIDGPQQEIDYDLKYAMDYNPQEQEKNPVFNSKLKKVSNFFKSSAIYTGSALVGFYFAGPLGAVAGIVATKLIKKLSKKKIKLVKHKKPKKISRVATMESQAREEYLANLDREINDLLSKPHNNYKLEILRVKYENQIKLMQQILDINLRKKLKKGEFVFHKLKIVDIKMQLDTATKNLEKINEQIAEYEKEQGLSKTNKKLIGVNQRLTEEKKDMKPLAVQKLKVYRSKLLKKRDKKATKIKSSVLRSGKFYDSIVRVKDFAVSRKYLFTPSEEIDEMVEVARTRK